MKKTYCDICNEEIKYDRFFNKVEEENGAVEIYGWIKNEEDQKHDKRRYFYASVIVEESISASQSNPYRKQIDCCLDCIRKII